jgi:hypothetical protein
VGFSLSKWPFVLREIPILSLSIKETNVCHRINKYNIVMWSYLFGSKTNTTEEKDGSAVCIRWLVFLLLSSYHTTLLLNKVSFMMLAHLCKQKKGKKVAREELRIRTR